MTYTYSYKTPKQFSNIRMNSDGEYLTGLWFEDSKDGLKHEATCEEKEIPIFRETSRWLDIYFSGNIPDFTPQYKIENLTPFRKEVSQRMCSIAYGSVVTYNDISKAIAQRRGLAKMSAQAWEGRSAGTPFVSLFLAIE